MNAAKEAVQNVIDHAQRFRPAPEALPDGVILTRATELRPMPIRWLWKHWLAKGKLHVLAGMPGQGKTTIAMAIASVVSRGGSFPDGSTCTRGNVVIWSGEDDPADGLLPKLIACGADPQRISFIKEARENGEVVPFDPARHMPDLMAQLEAIGDVSLLVVDPIVSMVAGDSHKNTEVRRALQPLVDLGSAVGCAVLGISHFSKGGQGGDPAQRVVGSIAFSAVARVVLVAAKVKTEDGEERRVLARGKSNIGPDYGGFEYRLEQHEPLPDIEASIVSWGKALDGTARELLADADQDGAERGGVSGAEEFLREILGSDTVPTLKVKEDAKEAGHSWASVRRASDKLGVIKRKGGMNDGWYWSLPRQGYRTAASETAGEMQA